MYSPNPAEENIHTPDENESVAPSSAASNQVEGAALDPEGIPSGNRPETAGIELDKTMFETADPVSLLGFAPEEVELPSLHKPELSDTEEDLAFGNLVDLAKSDEDENKGPAPKIIRKRVIRHEKGRFVRTLSATLIYLISVICVGLLAGMFIVSAINDVFAFMKDDSLYEITIEDSKMSLKELSEYLAEEGIIRHPLIFRIYCGLKNEEGITLKEGTYLISPSFNYDKILNSLNPIPPRGQIDITFTEGMTIDDIIDRFLENGIGTREGFEDVIENYRFDYWFLKDLDLSEDRYYRLEGYLYPDTYRFYTDSTEVAALTKMLDNFKKKVPSSYKEECEKMGLTMDQAVIIASLIEAECTWVADFEPVAGVFHNRLNSTQFNGRLDSDATIQYILRHTTGSRKEELDENDLKIDSPYNTRLYDGLPPGPICSPSLNALMAAILPDTESGYYYFVTQANGYNLYAKTYAEHLKNVETVENEKEES
ncbi:MAG: endolytic transglycosylase MltG [Clostridia bacterium]|nr:endolytic transglycosylase MltG [Clostridia bacterium]